MKRRLAAILLTDIVGYSRLTGLDEEGTIAHQRAHREEVFAPKIAQYGGRVVKTQTVHAPNGAHGHSLPISGRRKRT